MNDFSDFLLDDPPKSEKASRDRVRHLTTLYEDLSLPSPPSLVDAIRSSDDTPLGIHFPDLYNLNELVEALTNDSIAFILCEKISVDHNELQGILRRSKKPVWFYMDKLNPVELIERRMQGFTGVLHSMSEGCDLATLQYRLEFGRDFDLESGLMITHSQLISQVQLLDCPLIHIPHEFTASQLQELASTRVLMTHLDPDSNAAPMGGWQHKFGVLMNRHNFILGS